MAAEAFPFIKVNRIETESSVQGGPGPSIRRPIEDVSGVTPGFLESIFGGETNLVYALEIVALSKRGAIARGKFFVRTKNFFEPSLIETIHTETLRERNIKKGNPSGVYGVVLGVRK